MRAVTLTPRQRLFLSIGLGVVSLVGINLYLKNAEANLEKKFEMTTVLCAKKYIPRGRLITSGHVEKVSVPVAYVQPTAIQDVANLEGKRSRIDFLKGEQITRSKLIDDTAHLGLAWTLPPGKSAISLRLRPSQVVGGHVRPGDFVHIYGFLDRQPGWPEAQVRLLQKRVQVLGVNHNLLHQAGEGEAKTSLKTIENDSFLVILSVAPKKVGRLILAENKGFIKLVLTSPMEKTLPKTHIATFSSLRHP